MAGVDILETFEVGPNSALKEIVITLPNTTDSSDTCTVDLTSKGIAANGLLIVEGFEHTTDGSVIVSESITTSVTSGVLTVTFAAGTNDYRVVRITGKASPGDFD